MDKQIINSKIDSIIRCLQRVQSRIPEQIEDFEQDLDAQDIVILNLSRAIQLCVDIAMHMVSDSSQAIPQTMSASFEQLAHGKVISRDLSEKMKKSVGFRNVAIHNYDDVDLRIVFSVAHKHLDDFKQYINEISKFIN